MALAARRLENATYVTKVLMSMSSRDSASSGYDTADVDDVAYGSSRLLVATPQQQATSRQINRPVSATSHGTRASSGSRVSERKLVTVYEDEDGADDVDDDSRGRQTRRGEGAMRGRGEGRRRSFTHQPMTGVDDDDGADLGGHYWVV
jgi:hypothetical protein